MRTDGGREPGTPVSRRTFVAAAGVHASTAMVGVGTAADGSDGPLRVAATEPYRRGLRRAVTSDGRAEDGRDIRVVSGRADAVDRLGDTLDAFVSGRPTLSAAEAPPDVERFVTVTDWAALELSDDRWRECMSRTRVRERWDDDAPVETWSESDWDSVATVARAGESASAKRGDATASDSVTLVRGTRAYQYARGYGGLGHYSVEDGALDHRADVRSARRDGAAPLVRLGYVHVDRSALDGDLRSFLQAYDRNAGDGAGGVTHFP